MTTTQYVEDLAEQFESSNPDGIHVGPTDLAICAKALRLVARSARDPALVDLSPIYYEAAPLSLEPDLLAV